MQEKTPSYIKVGIFTVITTIIWIFFGVYRTLTTKPAPNIPSSILTPFSPNLDTTKVGEIERRISFDEGFAPTLTVNTPIPEATPTEEPILTPEPTVTPAPTESSTPTPEETK